MLCVITGEAGGPQLLLATDLARTKGPAYWFAVDHEPGDLPTSQVFPDPTYEALATVAERLAHPDRASKLAIADLDAMRTRRPPERAPTVGDMQDFPQLVTLSQLAMKGAPLAPVVVVHSLSRVFERATSRVLAQWTGQYEEAGIGAARAIASDAVARIGWDLAHAKGIDWAVVTAWDVETTMKGKVTGTTPMLPKAVLMQADLWLRAETSDEAAYPFKYTVMGCSGAHAKIGDQVWAQPGDWAILDVWRTR